VLIFFIAGLLLCLEHVFHWERIASRWRPAFSSHLISRVGLNGRRNTIQYIDSTMLSPRKSDPFGCTRLKPKQGSFPADSNPNPRFSLCFQYKSGSTSVLLRPIESTRITGHVPYWNLTCPFCALIRDLGKCSGVCSVLWGPPFLQR
jgi:hypothetical protein